MSLSRLKLTCSLYQGGYQVYNASEIPALTNATATFSATNTDLKAQVILTYAYIASAPIAILLSFYDGPSPGPSLIPFTKIPATYSDVSTRSFSSLAQASPDQLGGNDRGVFHTISTTGYTITFLKAIQNETLFYGQLAALHTGVFISIDAEPFSPKYGQFATDTAYPHTSSPLPLFLQFTWISPTEDAYWRKAIQTSVNTLIAVAKSEGIYDSDNIAYPNYALGTYSGAQVYGQTNLARLQKVKQAVDPMNVMGLSGGFTI